MTWRSKSPVCCHRKPTCSTSAVATASSHIIYRVCWVRLWLGWTWAATPPLGLNIFRMTAATFPLKMRASTQCCSVRIKSWESWKSCILSLNTSVIRQDYKIFRIYRMRLLDLNYPPFNQLLDHLQAVSLTKRADREN